MTRRSRRGSWPCSTIWARGPPERRCRTSTSCLECRRRRGLSEMYRPPAYAIDDIATLHKAIRARVFATIAAIVEGAVRFAYAPVVLDAETGKRGGVRFH